MLFRSELGAYELQVYALSPMAPSPERLLAEIPTALREADLAIGPTPDGGYWTLAAGRYQPAVVRQIDWGSADVYDQTCQRAAETGLVVATLPVWHDVDRPQDVASLRLRLETSEGSGGAHSTGTAPLRCRTSSRRDCRSSGSPTAGGSSPTWTACAGTSTRAA